MSDPDNTPSSPFGRGWIPAARGIGLPGEGKARDEWGEALALRQAQGERVSEGPDAAPSSSLPSSSVSLFPSAPLRETHGAVAPSVAAPRHDGFTPERQVRFLDRLASSGTVRAACLAAGVSPQAAYVARRRCARFAAAWDAALVLARDHAEAVLAERALDGVEEAVFYHGEEVARRRRFDARLLLAHLARLDRRAERDALASTRAARFDELLATLAGAEPEGLVAPEPWTRAGREADPVLPVARADHVRLSTEGLGPRAFARARRRAEAAWDRWQAEARARVDALRDGGAGHGAGGGGAASPPPAAADRAEGALEYKSCTGPVPPAPPAQLSNAAHPEPVEGCTSAPEPAEHSAPGPCHLRQLRPRAAPPAAPCRGRGAGIVFAAEAHGRRARSGTGCPQGEMSMIRNPFVVATAAAVAAGALAAGPALAAPTRLSATLSGPTETPPGQPDGVGGFTATVNPDTNDFCYTLWVDKIGKPTMAHVHAGAAGASGPPVLTLDVTGKDDDECLAVDKDKLDPIVANPAGYYVNVHTAAFPAGAVRGQLAK